jgi:histidinol phosphatase-like enzyme (inositol monophosphatase family)
MKQTVPEAELSARYQFAQQIVRVAGAATLTHFGAANLQVELKSDRSPVTIADREAEQLLRKEIAQEFPLDAILGEEFGERAGTSGFRWILDPIDGTKSFIHGVPLYTTLIGVDFQGDSQLGIIFSPATDELLHGALGHGAWYSKAGSTPQRAQVSKTSKLADSLLLTSEVACFKRNRTPDATANYLQLQDATRLVRTWGDAYGYMMVATGRAEVMLDAAMSVWDAAALLPLLTEAGGTFTDWKGNATIYAGEGLATNGLVLPEVLSLLA